MIESIQPKERAEFALARKATIFVAISNLIMFIVIIAVARPLSFEQNNLFWAMIIGDLFGMFSAILAERFGRDVVRWAIIGSYVPAVGILTLLCCGPKDRAPNP